MGQTTQCWHRAVKKTWPACDTGPWDVLSPKSWLIREGKRVLSPGLIGARAMLRSGPKYCPLLLGPVRLPALRTPGVRAHIRLFKVVDLAWALTSEPC